MKSRSNNRTSSQPTIGGWVLVIDGFDTATKVELDILLDEAPVKSTQMSVLVVNATHNIRRVNVTVHSLLKTTTSHGYW